MGASSIVSIFEIILALLKKIIGKPKGQEKHTITGLNKEATALIEILENINSKITNTTDISWAGFKSVETFKKELNKDIIAISKGDYSSLSTYNFFFLPTGDFQDISISNGWGEEYLLLAKKFEALYSKLY